MWPPRSLSIPSGGARAAVAALAALAGLAGGVRHAAAQPAPDANQIVAQMKAALEPDQTSVRRMTMTVHPESEGKQFTLVQARKRVDGSMRSLTVLLAPDDAKGIAYLTAEKGPNEAQNREWLFLPMVRRVRELVPAENQTSFLGSDLTYADLGFLDPTTTNKLLGTETLDGKKLYKVESVPNDKTQQWYVARIVTWVDTETLLPVKREFYSPSGMRFKLETFGSVARVQGVPTPFAIEMETIPASTSTRLKVEDVAYGLEVPDEYFGPDKLSSVANLAFWSEKKPAAGGGAAE